MEMLQQQLDLELSLHLHHRSPSPEPEEPAGFFVCTYCDRKFCSSQALGGHQNGHKYERALAKRRREIAAAMRASKKATSVRTAGEVDAESRPGGAAGAVGVVGAEPEAAARATRPLVARQSAAPVPCWQPGDDMQVNVERADELDLTLGL